MSEEHELQKRIAVTCNNSDTRLWRIDNGSAWHGRVTKSPDGRSGVIFNPRRFKYGPGVGFPDLFGFTMVEITEEMVGCELPVFTAIEVKTDKGRASNEQKNFIQMVKDHNGIAGIARNIDEAKKILNEHRRN